MAEVKLSVQDLSAEWLSRGLDNKQVEAELLKMGIDERNVPEMLREFKKNAQRPQYHYWPVLHTGRRTALPYKLRTDTCIFIGHSNYTIRPYQRWGCYCFCWPGQDIQLKFINRTLIRCIGPSSLFFLAY